MEYLLLIYADETQLPEMKGELLAEYRAYNAKAKKAGVFLSANKLRPTSTATTRRARGGKLLTTDGPFAETKEQLIGFYLLNCSDLDEALHWASNLPACRIGSVEVRPVAHTEL